STGSPSTASKIDGRLATKIFGGSLFTCTPAGACCTGTLAIRRCKEIEILGGTKALKLCSVFSAVAGSSDGKYVFVTSRLVMVTNLLTLSTSVFPFISTTPSTSLPPFGVSETAIRQLKSRKSFQSSTCG